MDAIDRKILAVLQDNAALSVAEIGSRVGLSSTPCWKRIQRLEAEGVVQKRVALVDQDKLGKALFALSEEDPTFQVKTDEETGQTVISGMGELHLEGARSHRPPGVRKRSACISPDPA